MAPLTRRRSRARGARTSYISELDDDVLALCVPATLLDLPRVALVSRAFARACQRPSVLTQIELPFAVLPQSTLARLAAVGNILACYYLGTSLIYGLALSRREEGLQLLRRAAVEGSPVRAEASYELWVGGGAKRDAKTQRQQHLQDALAANHAGAICAENLSAFRTHVGKLDLRMPFSRVALGDVLSDAARTACASAKSHYDRDLSTASILSGGTGLVEANVPCTNSDCHRWFLMRGKSWDERRRLALGLEPGAQLLPGPPRMGKCSGCLSARYCSRLCQVTDWSLHKASCSFV
jgi:hypothetical protein